VSFQFQKYILRLAAIFLIENMKQLLWEKKLIYFIIFPSTDPHTRRTIHSFIHSFIHCVTSVRKVCENISTWIVEKLHSMSLHFIFFIFYSSHDDLKFFLKQEKGGRGKCILHVEWIKSDKTFKMKSADVLDKVFLSLTLCHRIEKYKSYFILKP
jgi:hypothetical protein